MNIKLSDGIILSPILATGENRFIQGANRDTLNIIFSATEDIAALDAAFTAENCETITVTNDSGAEYIHKGYTVRAGLKKESVEVTPATGEADAVYEDRITVSMSQRTYTESQLASLTDTVDTLVMDALM
jgi:hypothetical protein